MVGIRDVLEHFDNCERGNRMGAGLSVPDVLHLVLEPDWAWQMAVQIKRKLPSSGKRGQSRDAAEALFTATWDADLDSQATVSAAKAMHELTSSTLACPRLSDQWGTSAWLPQPCGRRVVRRPANKSLVDASNDSPHHIPLGVSRKPTATRCVR